MSINVSEVLTMVSSSAEESLLQESQSSVGKLGEVLERNKSDIERLVEAHAQGDLDDDDLQYELDRAKRLIKAELITLQIATEAAVEKAVNSAINGLMGAVLKAV